MLFYCFQLTLREKGRLLGKRFRLVCYVTWSYLKTFRLLTSKHHVLALIHNRDTLSATWNNSHPPPEFVLFTRLRDPSPTRICNMLRLSSLELPQVESWSRWRQEFLLSSPTAINERSYCLSPSATVYTSYPKMGASKSPPTTASIIPYSKVGLRRREYACNR
jgi:hypothetical protein